MITVQILLLDFLAPFRYMTSHKTLNISVVGLLFFHMKIRHEMYTFIIGLLCR